MLLIKEVALFSFCSEGLRVGIGRLACLVNEDDTDNGDGDGESELDGGEETDEDGGGVISKAAKVKDSDSEGPGPSPNIKCSESLPVVYATNRSGACAKRYRCSR